LRQLCKTIGPIFDQIDLENKVSRLDKKWRL